MGIRVDPSTVLLLLAPLFLPKLYSVGAQGVARLRQKPVAAKHRAASAETRSWLQHRSSTLPTLFVALYSMYLLVFQRPFNFFTSLGYIPVTTPASKIQAALAWRNLADKYGEDLNVLTSLDIRTLYLHFGHANLLGCYRLLGSASPKDVLVYTSIQLSRTYIIGAILLAYSNLRWKNSILIASVAGFLYEVYSLGTTDMRLPTRESTIQSLADFLFFYRNIGFLFAAVITVLLPSKSSAKPLSSEEASLVQGIHALIQRQDMLQTRIRVIEAAVSSRVKKEVPGAASHLSADQKNGLKAWLRTIIDTDTKQESYNLSMKVEDAKDDLPVSAVKIEDVDDFIDRLPNPKSESLSPDEDPVVPSQVAMKRSSSEDSLSSPALSRSSSSSTPIDTPTPAMRRPMSLEITGATVAHVRNLLQDEDAAPDFDQPLRKRADFVNRLTQSLGPSGPTSHQDIRSVAVPAEDKAHRRSFSIYAAAPPLREPEEEEHRIADTTTANLGDDEETSPKNQSTHMLSLDEALHLAESDIATERSHEDTSPMYETSTHLSDQSERYKSFNSTPSFSLATSEDEGWTTVLSKKAKQRTL